MVTKVQGFVNLEHVVRLATWLRKRAGEVGKQVDRPIDVRSGSRGNVMTWLDQRYPCGTVGCIAGENGFMTKGKVGGLEELADDLNVSFFALESLCDLSAWPREWRSSFKASKLLGQRLRVMADYLEFWAAAQ